MSDTRRKVHFITEAALYQPISVRDLKRIPGAGDLIQFKGAMPDDGSIEDFYLVISVTEYAKGRHPNGADFLVMVEPKGLQIIE